MTDPSRFDVKGSGRGFYVLCDGRPVGPTHCRKDQAESLAARLSRAQKSRPRLCLACDRPFISEGPHNRLCTSCRRLGTDRPDRTAPDVRTETGWLSELSPCFQVDSGAPRETRTPDPLITNRRRIVK